MVYKRPVSPAKKKPSIRSSPRIKEKINQASDSSQASIKVVVRVRPPNQRENQVIIIIIFFNAFNVIYFLTIEYIDGIIFVLLNSLMVSTLKNNKIIPFNYSKKTNFN